MERSDRRSAPSENHLSKEGRFVSFLRDDADDDLGGERVVGSVVGDGRQGKARLPVSHFVQPVLRIRGRTHIASTAENIHFLLGLKTLENSAAMHSSHRYAPPLIE